MVKVDPVRAIKTKKDRQSLAWSVSSFIFYFYPSVVKEPLPTTKEGSALSIFLFALMIALIIFDVWRQFF